MAKTIEFNENQIIVVKDISVVEIEELSLANITAVTILITLHCGKQVRKEIGRFYGDCHFQVEKDTRDEIYKEANKFYAYLESCIHGE